MNLDPPQQRVGALAELPAVLAELGYQPDRIMAEFGIVSLSPDDRLPTETAIALLDRATHLTGLADLGLRLGSRSDLRCLGIVGSLMGSAPTLRQALLDYIGVQSGYSESACAYLVPMGDCFAFGFGIYDRHGPGADQVYGLAMGLAMNIMRELSGGLADPVEVQFCHRAPSQPGLYQRLLRSEVRFNEHQCCIILTPAALNIPNPRADAARRAQLTATIAASMRLSEKPAAARLRHLLRPALSMGDASISSAAVRLGMSTRTLNRKLMAEGTTFAAERDRVRFWMACELLNLTDLAVGEISHALSYSNHSAFVRSFRRWSGAAPSDWRAAKSQLSATPGDGA